MTTMKTMMILISIAALVLALKLFVPDIIPSNPGASSANTFPFLIEQEALFTWRLPAVLNEVSGLVAVSDTHVLAHNDEFGVIYRIDITTGEVVQWQQVGKPPLAQDFEGITVMGEDVLLIDSKGRLVIVPGGVFGGQPNDGFEVIKTGVKDYCEVEGLETLPNSNAVLILCKEMKGKGAEAADVYHFNLATRDLGLAMQINFADAGEKVFPSGIANADGGYVVLAARDHLVLEVSNTGAVVSKARLGKKRHPQAEGVALVNGNLVVADEGGLLTVYRARASQL